MAKPAPPEKHLKLYTEQPPKHVRPQIEAISALPELLRAFQTATGWRLIHIVGADQSVGAVEWSATIAGGPEFTTSRLGLESLPEQSLNNAAPAIRTPPAAAKRLAGSIAQLLGELLDTRRALWRREAELAAGVPLVPHREEQKHLAERLEAVLRAGVETIGGDAIALYLLDEATTELKLRASCGLPFDRFTAPARPLAGALADLEALLGHAVVLNDDCVMSAWSVPEDFPAAVCVPVSTPTVLLGTLWLFCNQNRDFTDQQTNMLEVTAGRLAADLEREMLLRTGVDGANLKKQLAAAERLQRNELPTVSPLLDGWSLAGWVEQAGEVGGAFYDWFCLPGGLLAAAIGNAAQQGVAGSLTANAVKAALRAHAGYHQQPEPIVQQVNLTLWTGSAGDQQAALVCGLINTYTGRVQCAWAGQPDVWLLSSDKCQPLTKKCPSLGESPESMFVSFDRQLEPGESLVMVSRNYGFPGDLHGTVQKNHTIQDNGDTDIVKALAGKSDLSADELVAILREILQPTTITEIHHDTTVLVVKRTS